MRHPSRNFNISTVKQRLYRGRCIHNDYINATIANFQSKREELLQVIDELKVAQSRTTKSMTSYIEKLFKTLESEKRVNSFLIKKCI